MRNVILILLSFFLNSCNREIKFNKIKWSEYNDGIASDYRNKMLTDLTTNYKLVGLKYLRLVDLLGNPDYTDDTSLSYFVIVDYGFDIDPVYTKNLDFTFSKDSTITSYKLEEWEK
jgi:hypothetical protein